MEKLSKKFVVIANHFKQKSGIYYPNYLLGLSTLGLLDLVNQDLIKLDHRQNILKQPGLSKSKNPYALAILSSKETDLDSILLHFMRNYADQYSNYLNRDLEHFTYQSIKTEINDIFDDYELTDLIVLVKVLDKTDLLDKMYERDDVKQIKNHLTRLKLDEQSSAIRIMNQVQRLYMVGLSIMTTMTLTA